jgi:hypothetical protein
VAHLELLGDLPAELLLDGGVGKKKVALLL